MTTKHSPLSALKAQADKIAAELKRVERGESTAIDVAGKLGAARQRDWITFGVVMDDKVFKIDMTWTTIKATSEVGLSEYILKQMRENRDVDH